MDTLTATITRISQSVTLIEASLRFILGFTIVLSFSLIFAYSYRQKVITKRDKILHLLLNVFIPTAVSWEHDYSKIFNYSRNDRNLTIRLPLNSLLQNLCNGSLEFRDLTDFAPLLTGRLRVSGWTIALRTEVTCWLRLFYRLALDKAFPGMYRTPFPCGYTSPFNASSGQQTETTARHLEMDTTILSEPPRYDLDLISYGHVETAIRDIRRSQQGNNLIALEFSTVCGRVSHFTPLFLACGVPFLEDESRSRLSTPLLLTLHHVVELLSDSGYNIQSLHDVSAAHARLLLQETDHLVAEKVIRTSFTGSKGLERWRKARLLLSWEVALLTEGHMIRWKVLCSPDSTKQAYIIDT